MSTESTPDVDYSKLDQTMRQYDYAEHALIQVLHRAQEQFGYLSKPTLEYIAREMNIPISAIRSVVTFYSFFNTTPPGKHKVRVCMGTACYVKGAERILERLKAHLEVDVNETSRDHLYTLQVGRCFGACGLAPAVLVDDDVHAKLNSERMVRLLRRKYK